ncbi:acetylxylan esterase [Paenibacillus albidus]|nr:acetylxylan esterase [Paenibacillus albidus]
MRSSQGEAAQKKFGIGGAAASRFLPTDISLPNVKTYEGSSPKPEDFDQFWVRALQELDVQPLDFELIFRTWRTGSRPKCYG